MTARMLLFNKLIFILVAVFPLVSLVSGYSQSTHGNYTTKDGKECRLCSPGFYMKEPCRAPGKESVCEKCPFGFFTTGYNNSTKCQFCNLCPRGHNVSEDCSPTKDRVCKCPEGTSWKSVTGGQGKCEKCQDEEIVLNVTATTDIPYHTTEQYSKGESRGATISLICFAVLVTFILR